MSRISTDDGFGDALPFRRTLAITVVVLVALVVVFAGLNYLQGPKLSSGRVDAVRVVAQTGQQLRLFANQNLSVVKKSQVSITPAVPFSVSTAGEVIAVQFGSRLSYGTRYSVRVEGVSNAFQPRSTVFAYSFSTAAAEVYYLKRAQAAAAGQSPGNDTIVRTGLKGSSDTVVYSAPRIQQFAVFERAIAITTQNDDGSSTLSLVGLGSRGTATGIAEQLQLPQAGTVEQLEASPVAGVLGFVFTSSGPVDGREYSSTLMTVDLTGAHSVTPVLDVAQKPLAVLDWLFLTGSSSIVAQSENQTVQLIDTAKPGAVVPLGQYTSLGTSSPDGTHIVVGDIFGQMSYSLADGKETRLPSLPLAGSTTSGGDLALVGSGTARVQRVAVFDAATGGRYKSFLVYEDGTNSRVLYQTPDDNGSIDGFSVSPNGQYVAVNVVPNFATSISDGYAVDPQSRSISTLFIDIQSGMVVRSVDGFDVDW